MRLVPLAIMLGVVAMSGATAVAAAPSPTFDLPPVIDVPAGEKVDPDGIVRFPAAKSEPFTFEGDQRVCDFPVRFEELVNRGVVKTFKDGHQRVFGPYVVRLTNVTTGRQQTLDVSGPTTLTPHAGGGFRLAMYGRSLIFLFPSDPGGPSATYLRRGSAVQEFPSQASGQTPSGFVITASAENRVDVCATLS